MGKDTLEVSRELHALNRKRLVEKLVKRNVEEDAFILLKGEEAEYCYSSFKTLVFRQVCF